MCVRTLFLIISVLAFYLNNFTSAQCSVCVDGFACISENQVSTCQGPFPDLNKADSCLAGAFCLNGKCQIGVTPSCTVCDACKLPQLFTCVSKTEYKNCESNQIFTCDTNQECFIGREPICGDPNVIGQDVRQCYKVSTTPMPPTETPTEPTPPITEPSPQPSTESPQNFADRYCKRKQLTGNYRSPFVNDCTEYIQCRRVRSDWSGVIVKCRDKLLFNPATGRCVSRTFFVCN